MKMALSFNTKPQNEIFITSLFDVNNKCKSPQGDSPPPPQEASHTPPAEMKYTWGASSRLGSRFYHQMARMRRTS